MSICLIGCLEGRLNKGLSYYSGEGMQMKALLDRWGLTLLLTHFQLNLCGFLLDSYTSHAWFSYLLQS